MANSPMTFLGLDVGGANLKVADRNGWAHESPFAFWKQRDEFPRALRDLRQRCQAVHQEPIRLAVTMTAELADCFATKQEGVREIVSHIEAELAVWSPRFYTTDGNLVASAAAQANWRPLAASNWHATARYLFGRNGSAASGFLIDVGSTTTDVIPVDQGVPVSRPVAASPDTRSGVSDFDRLAQGQLVYLGVGRTPVATLIQVVRWNEHTIRMARETFATMMDVLLWKRLVAGEAENLQTADGRPGTRRHAGERLARMACVDLRDVDEGLVDAIAEQTWQCAVNEVARAIDQVRKAHRQLPLVFRLAGSGVCLAQAALDSLQIAETTTIEIGDQDPLMRQVIPARAVAEFYFRQHHRIAPVVG